MNPINRATTPASLVRRAAAAPAAPAPAPARPAPVAVAAARPQPAGNPFAWLTGLFRGGNVVSNNGGNFGWFRW